MNLWYIVTFLKATKSASSVKLSILYNVCHLPGFSALLLIQISKQKNNQCLMCSDKFHHILPHRKCLIYTSQLKLAEVEVISKML